MGNTPSVEAPRGGPRTAQKLSKPKTGNPATAGLLSSNGPSDSSRRPSIARRMSLPYGSTPAPSPLFSEAESEVGTDQVNDKKASRFPRQLFRSRSSQETPQSRRRNHSVGPSDMPQSRRLSRANSVNMGPEASYDHAHLHIHGSMSLNTSRTSVNYDMFSYESRRLLNLVEEPMHEDNSIASDSHFQASDISCRNSNTPQPQSTGPTASLPRSNSDISLYAPMRRRSLMTPGLATRTGQPSLAPPLPRHRYSLPSTPARRDSLESMGADMLQVHPYFQNPESIPRALTPCEAEYKQTGAFKHGTLRITNGSPATSPAADADDMIKGSQSRIGHPDGYFDESEASSGALESEMVKACRPAAGPAAKAPSRSISPSPINTSFTEADGRETLPVSLAAGKTSQNVASPTFLPNLSLSPSSMNDTQPMSTKLQTTSKHTAVEDELFEDEYAQSAAEILDVRIDPNAKSLPPRPRLIAEARNSREISRSDSGVVATPTSEYSNKHLSKADSGYSSNVSLRSLSAKPSGSERAVHQEVDASGVSDSHDGASMDLSPKISTGSSGGTPDVVVSRPSTELLPPPVSKKDDQTTGPVNPRLPKECSSAARPAVRMFSLSSSTSPPNAPSSDIGHQPISGNGERPEASPTSPTSSAHSTSLSISSAPRKSGKLQRLLSGSRVPLTAHATHPSEETGVPPVPKDIKARLHEHAGLVPIHSKKFSLRPEPSKETLGTIMSVGSLEAHYENHATIQGLETTIESDLRDDKKAHDRAVAQFQSISSSIHRAASSVLTRKALIKKPVFVQQKTESSKGEPRPLWLFRRGSAGQLAAQEENAKRVIEPVLAESYFASASEQTSYTIPHPRTISSRTSTMSQRSEWNGPPEVLSPTALGPPPIPANFKVSRSSPPVSMRTRNAGSLLVPPPLRPQSTPPGTFVPYGTSSLSRKSSREGIQSYPPATNPFLPTNGSLSSQSSREHIQSYPFNQPNPHYTGQPHLGTHRSMNFHPHSQENRSRSRERRIDTDLPCSRRSSVDTSRQNSFTSQSSRRSAPIIRPGQSQPPHPKALRHRSSYDEESFIEQQLYVQDTSGPYPSMRRSNTPLPPHVPDQWNGRPMPPHMQQWDQPIRYPPYVPRGHHRHRSLDQKTNAVPYRVLHSYNSPAYRNAPIWG
ncbi:hypothetical protein F4778DRAFT_398242 [Xylariomycetidae sp. FL2044]|nr:hypothetical protein F4778DRAFT_398242 [Xylariomycetidae sp. FL2044]